MYKKGVRRAKGMRIIALLLAVILFIPLTPGLFVSASAADADGNAEDTTIPDTPDDVFTIEEKVITGETGSYTETVVKGVTDTYKNSTELVIPSGVTMIADDAFAGMESLTTVTIPDTVKSIGSRSFFRCRALANITIPASVDIIGVSAFARSGLTSVTFLARAEGTTKICDGAFEQCSSLTTVYASHSTAMDEGTNFTYGVSNKINVYANTDSPIGQYATEKNTQFTLNPLAGDSEAAYSYEVLSDGTVKVTGYYSDKQEAVIPETIGGKTVTVVGGTAFAGEMEGRDVDVTSVKVSKNVKDIETGAFSGIENDFTLDVVEENEHLSDWVLGNQNDYDVGTVPNTLQKVTIEAEPPQAAKVLQTSVGMSFVPYVFEASTDEKKVTTTIQTVPNLKENNSPQYIFDHWELTADDPTSATEGATVNISGMYIKDVNLPETELTIPPVSFTGVTLTAVYVEVPEAPVEDSLVRKYDSSNDQHYICAYNGVVVDGSAIKPDLVIADSYEVDVSGNKLSKLVTQIGYVGDYTSGDPPTTVSYTGLVFKDKGLKTVEFGAGVENVLPNAFDEAYGLQKIEVRGRHDISGTIAVGKYYSRSVGGAEGTGVLFKKTAEGSELVAYPLGLTNESYVIPDDVTSIGERAFAGCTNIKNVTLNTNLKSIGNEAFQGCVNLGTVHMGESLENIGDSAFEGCTNLTNVTWGGNVKTIGNKAFDGTLLTTFELPLTIGSIGDRAFANCMHLEKITIRNRTVEFGEKVFEGSGAVVPGTPQITLAGYINSTTEQYVTANGALENLKFEAVTGGTAGDDTPDPSDGYQVVVDSNVTDWLWISEDGGASHVNELTVPAGTNITVGVRKLEESVNSNETRLLNKIKITSDTPTEGEALSIVMPVKLMIIENQKAGLTLDDITYNFPMPEAHVIVSIDDGTGWKTKTYDSVPGGTNAAPVPDIPAITSREAGPYYEPATVSVPFVFESLAPPEPESPTEPTEPPEPAEPEAPAEPSEIVEPEAPTEPTEPSEPAGPETPAEPPEPVEPENPTESTEPPEPAEPDAPAEMPGTENSQETDGASGEKEGTV